MELKEYRIITKFKQTGRRREFRITAEDMERAESKFFSRHRNKLKYLDIEKIEINN